MNLAHIVFSIFFGIVLADFVSGFIHWIQDRYAKPTWPVVGRAIAKAHAHHSDPLRFLHASFLKRNGATLILVSVIGLAVGLLGGFNLLTLTALAVGGLSNEIHATTHRKRGPLWIRFLRFFGLIQSPRHHAVHHKPPGTSHYCVITNYLNRTLDHIGFWKWLEFCLLMVGIWPNGSDSSASENKEIS